jgi:thiamine biosynthesis lipoprotein
MRTLPQLSPHRTGGGADRPTSETASVSGFGSGSGAGSGRPGTPATTRSGASAATGTVRAWGGRATVSLDDAAALPPALRLARHHLRAVARACDRRSPTAQVHRLAAAAGDRVVADPLLLRAVHAALETAADTDGLVDPTTPSLRGVADGPGSLPVCGRAPQRHGARGWRCVETTDGAVRVPGGTALDLTATALPMALDDLALVVAQLTGVGLRVALHGRAAGCAADGRRYGAAATDGRRVVDPRTGRPAEPRWARVQVVAGSARAATALALAAVLHGEQAPRWLAARMRGEPRAGRLAGVAARLVAPDGEVVLVGDPAGLASGALDLVDDGGLVELGRTVRSGRVA